ncbi:MAG: hypothetical protein HZA93_07810 [Verrucomicrobia bacterium]|nr:hypothetical protein [Verrucomicrobiota bacterium]
MNVPTRLSAMLCLLTCAIRAAVPVDLSGLAAGSEIAIASAGADLVSIEWPAEARDARSTGSGQARASLTLNLAPDKPLLESLAWRTAPDAPATIIAEKLTPLTVLTVGERDLARNGWMVFFDKVHTRPAQRFPARLRPAALKATSTATRARLSIDGLTAGAFAGRFELTIFSGSPLVMIEAVLATNEDRRAILYEAGLVAPFGRSTGYAWLDPRTGAQTAPADTPGSVRAARFRTAALEFARGSVAVFPPPHRYLYPLDFADNFGFNWIGRHYDASAPGDGIGVRQPPAGDNRYVPWVNAPPGTEQRLPLFLRFGPENATASLRAIAAYTRGDRFADLAGYKKFTSHYHVEHTADLLERQKSSGTAAIPDALREPGFVRAFRAAGIDIVHLAEFHFGTTPKLGAEERLKQLRLMHAECARLSDEKFLLLPGEEPNVHLGGHWLSFFPKPVLWVLQRPAGTPFVETNAAGETVYHVGSPADVLELMRREHGLMWTAHARIKGSIPFPDGQRDTPFFQSPQFLGAAWKAMPADYSRDTLGWRVLDLLDDMNNWGADKRALGEVDVFKIEPHSELYGHMNVNYLKLAGLPRFADGWQPVLDVLRSGEFFVTTGEILASDFRVTPGVSPTLSAKLQWTLPLAFAELVGGDGTRTVRHRVDLSDTRAFGEKDFSAAFPATPGLRWVRLAVWDIAGNGAFTQPVALAP